MEQWWLWSAENSAIREPITQVITEIAINWDLCGQSQQRGQGATEQRSDLWSLQVVSKRMNRREARAGHIKVYPAQCPVSSAGQLQLPGEANKIRTNIFPICSPSYQGFVCTGTFWAVSGLFVVQGSLEFSSLNLFSPILNLCILFTCTTSYSTKSHSLTEGFVKNRGTIHSQIYGPCHSLSSNFFVDKLKVNF